MPPLMDSTGDLRLTTLRVYLVEDSFSVVRLLRELLQGAGAKVVGDSDRANTAISDIRALRPDVVVVDIALKEGNGFDVLKALRDRFGAKGPAAVVLTNHTFEPFRKTSTRLGAKYFFDKSSQIPEMLRALQALPRIAAKGNGGG
jgi:DNA-binding NarL/FixJ family response regulator